MRATAPGASEVELCVNEGLWQPCRESLGHHWLDWYPEACDPVEAEGFIPARWSRRRPSPTDDMKSVAYLCCPVQTKEGWAFITALTTFLKGDFEEIDEDVLRA